MAVQKLSIIQQRYYLSRLPGAMVARLASIAQWYQKFAGSSPAVVIFSPSPLMACFFFLLGRIEPFTFIQTHFLPLVIIMGTCLLYRTVHMPRT